MTPPRVVVGRDPIEGGAGMPIDLARLFFVVFCCFFCLILLFFM